jgi:hypothetical protein
MKKSLLFFVALTMILPLCAAPLLAVIPVNPADPILLMYADNFTAGPVVPVKMGPYNGWTHAQRLCPANALGKFDAMPGIASFNERFFGVASREWTEYTFPGMFMNVNGAPDIEFAEVTRGGNANSWMVEAVKVYLTGAYVRDAEENVVPYVPVDEETGIGYYAGIAWNRTGIQFVPQATRLAITESYLPDVIRAYDTNTFKYDGDNIGWTQFNLPEEVVCAEGIHLVDITKDVYAVGGAGETYTGSAGALVKVVNCPIYSEADITTVTHYDSGIQYTGNTDGYDLDAIRVYRCIPGGSRIATGSGARMLEDGTWFMYNYYDGTIGSFPIQAGNPKNGPNIIGKYTITANGDDTYTVTYDIDDTIVMDGYIYNIMEMESHLAISDTMNFTVKSDQDDNHEFGVPIYDADGKFFIFAYWAVEYR